MVLKASCHVCVWSGGFSADTLILFHLSEWLNSVSVEATFQMDLKQLNENNMKLKEIF